MRQELVKEAGLSQSRGSVKRRPPFAFFCWQVLDKSGFIRILIFIVGIMLFHLVVSAITAPAQPLPRTDAVYLLDVTSSMVGYTEGIKPCDKSKDILNSVLDLLLTEIERFSQGRLILITFAEGPYDLDEAGPIQDVYSIEISSDADKLTLKQFIRPKEYGPPAAAPSWSGIYETVWRRTCVERRNIGNTSIYDTVLMAVQKLEELQTSYSEGLEAYVSSHTQEIIVFTDGKDNASRNSFDKVLAELQARYFQMSGRFHYKRYLFSHDPKDIDQAKDECMRIGRKGAGSYVQNVVAPEIAQLVIVDFDRSVLEFSDNLWTPAAPGDVHTVTLRNIHIYYDHAKEHLLSGAQLAIQPVRPEDFGLPGTIAVRVRTEPAPLIFPLTKFDLSLSFEPFSLLEQYVNRTKQDKLTGILHFVVIPPGRAGPMSMSQACYVEAQGVLIDVRRASLLVEISFKRPELVVSVQRSTINQLRIDLVPNSVLAGLTPNQRSVVIQSLPAGWADLKDEQGALVPYTQPIELSHPRTFFAIIKDRMSCLKSIEAEIRLAFLEPFSSSMINGEIRPRASFSYRIHGVDLHPSQLVTENLWTPQHWRSPTDEVTIPFTLNICAPSSGTLHISAEAPDLPAYVRVQPARLEIHQEGSHPLQLIIQPQQDWMVLAKSLEKPGPHLWLRVHYEVSDDEVLVATPAPLPVTLRYLPQYVIARLESLLVAQERVTPGASVYKLDIQSNGIPSDQEVLILEGPGIWRIQRIGTSQVFSLAGPLSLGVGEYELQLEPHLSRSVQQGMLRFKTRGHWPLLIIRPGSHEVRLPEGQYELPYSLSVEDFLITVHCDGLPKGPRWRRGQALLRCIPQPERPYQGDQLEFIPLCGSGLWIRISNLEFPCGTPIPLETFEIVIASDAPAGTQLAQQLDGLKIEARYSHYQQPIVVDLQKPQLRGYLLPLLYDQLGERVLLGLVGLAWGLGGLTLLGLVLYAALIQKENPLIFFINYVWYEERWRRLATIWLIVGVVFVVVQLLVSWGLRLSYGI